MVNILSVKICVICGAKKHKLKLFKTMNKQEIWKKILNIVITVLTAIATTFGVSSCMNLMQ